MNGRRYRIAKAIVDLGFCDPARPIEWLSILALTGWVQFLLQSPKIFALPIYSAFSALPPLVWAAIMMCVIGAQVVGMLPVREAARIRFFAMAVAAGLWVIIAFSFWSAVSTPISARTATSIAFVAAMTGVYLGWASQKS